MSEPPITTPEDPYPSRPVTQAARDVSVETLRQHFAQDHLTVEEYETRVSLALKAESMGELEATLKDLPALDPRTTEDIPVRIGSTASPTEVKAEDRIVAFFGEARRSGSWVPARDTDVTTTFGSAVIDLREARFGPGESTINVVAIFGSVEVIAPPGIHLECNGSAVFGEFEERHSNPQPPGPGAPLVRIEGTAVFGSVEVEYRHPGESRREARRRRKKKRDRRD